MRRHSVWLDSGYLAVDNTTSNEHSDMRAINLKLWLVLILTGLIPLIYTTARVHFLGSLPDPWALSIAAQVAWLGLFYEVIQEALLLPLAYVLGREIRDHTRFAQCASTALILIIACYLAVTVLVLWRTPELVSLMQQQPELYSRTVRYIRLESIAIFISSLYAFLSLVLVLKDDRRTLYRLLLLQVLMTLLCDRLLVSQQPFSLQLGVEGIAISNILVNSLLAMMAVRYLSRAGITIRIRGIRRCEAGWLKTWLGVGWRSGLESLVRNAAFITMILQLVNQVEQAGIFWVANQFIWGWLLLPVIALGTVVKQDAATRQGLSSARINRYLGLTGMVILLWALTAPYWQLFIAQVMGIAEAEAVARLVMLMAVFYALFSFNSVLDSYFYGMGRTDLMLYQSLCVNILFYGGAFVCYQIGLFIPTLTAIALMFGVGLTLDTLLTWLLYRWLQRSQDIGVSGRSAVLRVQTTDVR